MKNLEERLNILRQGILERKVRIMILGLGSVGTYLMDYILAMKDADIELLVVGRNREKMESDVNIVRVATMIRGQNRTKVKIISNIDFNDIQALTDIFKTYQPDMIVNSSRAYAGLKYGSISWKNVRAYGIWAPLAIKYVKNIMEAYEEADCNAIVINTSYSDAVIPWLKSAGKAYPDFGSGNLNHLLPRIKLAVADVYKIEDYWNIDVTFATSHFHDVVISKEGQTENVEQLIRIEYNGIALKPDMDAVFSKCCIAMPVDAKRNMMNASSNFEIIHGILAAVRNQKKVKLHCPGVFGEIGGYPVIIDGSGESIKAYIDQSVFSLTQMKIKNRESIYLDGIKNVEDGVLYYTDELVKKVKKAFGVSLMEKVEFSEIDAAAQFLITEIIEKNK